MIKKSVFEDEIVAGMHKELVKNATNQDMDNLDQAVDYLNSAIDILEDAGMTAQANKVLNILSKIAAHNVQKIPSLQTLLEKGVTIHDIKNAGKGDLMAKAKVNLALHEMGCSPKEIVEFVGAKNYMPADDAKTVLDPERSYGKIHEWLKDPKLVTDPNDIKPGETLTFKSLSSGDEQDAKKHSLTPKPDAHSKGLTSEKMLKNLLQHGTVFNMVDDGNAADDLLDADVGNDPLNIEINDDPLEISDNAKTFEDSE